MNFRLASDADLDLLARHGREPEIREAARAEIKRRADEDTMPIGIKTESDEFPELACPNCGGDCAPRRCSGR